ncbi:MAG TPA: hypothetical protein DCW90_06170 [Lachnospiraceae bacterium]|nr:hypothetical protein [uncultured Lachnoclostridium sp.]HAU85083.1 hypothetical protein [Lachnospiraceae bacterium]
MSVKRKVMEALLPLGVPVEFLTREDDGKFPFIVFNVSETPYDFADDEEEGTLSMISVNLFSKPEYNFENLKKEIIKAMKENGFIKNQIPATEWLEKEKVFNQPMAFVYYQAVE